jgi:hypothetical protein
MKTSAYISEDRRYRYWLLREWDASLPILAVFGVKSQSRLRGIRGSSGSTFYSPVRGGKGGQN